jgi:hypothetical protein
MSTVPSEISKYMGSATKLAAIWGTIIYNVKAYGAKGDGVVNDAAAIQSATTAATTNGGIIFFPPGTYKISSALTVPSNVTLWFANGAKLSIDTGITVTINGPIDAGLYQIFSGAGLVRGTPLVEKIYVQWFGVYGDSSDIQAVLQKAVDFVNLNGIKLFFPNGNYFSNTGGGITINYGYPYKPVVFEGETQSGAVLVYNQASGDFIYVKPVDTALRPDAGLTGISYFAMSNLSLSGQGGVSTATGLRIGRTGYVCDSISNNTIENVTIKSFGQGIFLESCRHINFTNVIVSSSGQRSLNISCFGNADFAGDYNFNACEFNSGTDMAILHFNSATSTGGGIGGIHYNDCIIYGNVAATRTVYFVCSSGGRVADTWFNGCALDGGTNDAFFFNIGGTSQIFQIFFNSVYAVGYTTFFNYINSSSETFLRGEITMESCMIGATPLPFSVNGISNLIVKGCFFKDVTARSVFTGASKNITMIGNQFMGNLLSGQCVQLDSTVGSAIIKDNFGNFANTSAFVENLTSLPATKLVIADNLQTV